MLRHRPSLTALIAFLLTAVIAVTLPASSAAADDTPPPAPITINLTGVSQKPLTIAVTSSQPDSPYPPGTYFIATWINGKGENSTAVTTAAADGTVTYTVNLWKSTVVTIVAADTPTIPLYLIYATITPQRSPILPPREAPSLPPKYSLNPDPPAIGHGPHPAILPLSSAQRRTMTGISWRPGCVPLNQLKELHINYWGIDGYRHRGILIVRNDTAHRTLRMMSHLYRIHYRFHSIHPVDRYGKNPHGPGGDDYASMQAGNTSMFNCRYIVGKERQHAISPHSSGRTIDINPWENPYVSATGIYPNSWWLTHTNSPLSFRHNHRALRIIQRHGWRWGGGYRDYHHFQRKKISNP